MPSSVSMDVPAQRRRARAPSQYADQTVRLTDLARLPLDDVRRAGLRDELIMELLPVGGRLAARYTSSSPWLREELTQVASIGVINAVDRWDPDRADGGDILAYLVPYVRGEILRWFRDRTWAVRVPRRLKELGVAIRRVSDPLAQELGRAPRPSELARRLGVDVEEVLEALRAEETHHTTTLDAPGADDTPLRDRVGELDPDLDGVENAESLRPLLVALPERERRIVLLRFFGGLTQSEIAREVGISQMHVSRLLARTLAELRTGLVDGPADPGDHRCGS